MAVTQNLLQAPLALAYTAYLAQDIVLLLMVTGLISLLLSPGVHLLNKLKVPRSLGAMLFLALLIVPSSLFISQLQQPISKWAQLLPELSNQVSQQLDVIDNAIESSTNTNQTVQTESDNTSWFNWFGDDAENTQLTDDEDSVVKTHLKESLLVAVSSVALSAPLILLQVFATIILTLFTLIYAPRLFQHYLTLFVAQDKQDKVSRFATDTQRQLSRYILTVSLINTMLAIIAILFLYALGLDDALLLGTVVGLLNFIPYVGPTIALGLIAIGGLVQWGADVNFMIMLLGILSLNVIESQFITPLVLAKNMRINPLLIILFLLISGWMWGLVGVIIAVPILVCIKLTLSQSSSTKKWVDFLAT